MVFIVFSILGQIVNPLFFAFHTLDLVKRSPILQDVIKSFVVPWKMLVITLIFTLIIVYMFAIAGYAYIPNDYNGNAVSLWVTFITTFDRCFKYSGGIGPYLAPLDATTIDVFRLFYDNLFNILIMIIMINIVSTIIMDTFTNLREVNEKDQEDRLKKCFVCSEHQDTIERLTNRDFRFHTFYEHNVWNYVFFIAYIVKKEETEYSGVESHVRFCYDHSDISWFPQYQALSFHDQDANVKKKLTDKLQEVENLIEAVNKDTHEANRKS